jgi:hypothetical protein
MTFETPVLKLASLVGVLVLGGSLASNPMKPQSCSLGSTRINLAAQQAVKARLPKLYFPIFYYLTDDVHPPPTINALGPCSDTSRV